MYKQKNSFFLIIILACLANVPVFAQSPKYDSLLTIIRQNKDYNYDQVFQELNDIFKNQFDSARAISELEVLFNITAKQKNQVPQIKAHILQFSIYQRFKNSVQAIRSLNEAYDLAKETNLKYREAECTWEKYKFYFSQNKDDLALKNALIAAELYKQMGNKRQEAEANYEIAALHYKLGNHDFANNFCQLAMNIGKDSLHSRVVINTWNMIALTHKTKKEYNKAIENFEKALKIAQNQKDTAWIGIMNGNIGSTYLDDNQPDRAIDYLKVDYIVSAKYKEWTSAALALQALGDIYLDKKNLPKAKNYYDSALFYLFKEKALNSGYASVYKSISKYYYTANDIKKAYIFYDSSVIIRDSLRKRREEAQLLKIQSSYDFDKKQAEVDLLIKDNELNKETIARQNIISVSSGVVIILITLLAFIYYKNNKEKQKANHLLIEKQHEIVAQNEELFQQKEEILVINEELERQKRILEDTYAQLHSTSKRLTKSIQYAQNIQQVILPDNSAINSFFSAHYCIYLPKDTVSGDFYWFSHLGDGNTTKSIFGCADCTGHGVPGGFMSMIASTLLHEIVNIKSIHEPSRIMKNLDAGIRKLLKQHERKNMDGLDISLCLFEKSIEEKECKVTFSGAKSSIYYQNPGNQITKLVGTSRSIGGNQGRMMDYTDIRFSLEEGSYIYFSTDGFIDQNNKERVKFGSRQFKEMLEQAIFLPFSEQKDFILSSLNQHQQNEEQRDDITVIGIKL